MGLPEPASSMLALASIYAGHFGTTSAAHCCRIKLFCTAGQTDGYRAVSHSPETSKGRRHDHNTKATDHRRSKGYL